MGIQSVIMRCGDRAALMGRMIIRLDVDIEELSAHALGTRLYHASRGCMTCRNAEACREWLAAGTDDRGYEGFCPNAALFSRFARPKPAERVADA